MRPTSAANIFRTPVQSALLPLSEARLRQGSFAPPPLRGFLATMSPSDSRPGPWMEFCLSPSRGDPITPGRVSQVPRLISWCALPPTTPEGSASARARCFPADAGFTQSGRLAAPSRVTRPNRVRLRCGSHRCPHQASAIRLATDSAGATTCLRAIHMADTFQSARSARLVLADQMNADAR